MEEVRIKDISKEKIEAMFQLLHEENKVMMVQLLAIGCYPKDFEKARHDIEENWNELFKKVLEMD